MSKLNKSKGASQLTGLGYYDDYHSIFDLRLMQEKIDHLVAGSNQEIREILRGVDRAKFLVLGSATAKNIHNVTKIAHYLRGKAHVSSDTIYIIDANDRSVELYTSAVEDLDRHSDWSGQSLREASKDSFPYPQFKVEKADMRDLPHESDSQDVVISDYTLNYVDSLEDIRSTFSEVRRVLKSGGLFFMTIIHNLALDSTGIAHDPGIKELKGGVQINKFRLASYLKLAEESGLKRVEMEIPLTERSDDPLILFRNI